MLDREWVSIVNPADPYDRYVFDVSFLLSEYTCVYGAGCPGTGAGSRGQDPVVGCCGLGAYFMDEDDQERVEGMVEVLGAEHMQFYAEARRRGIVAQGLDGDSRTRVKDGACIFQNREDWPAGPGCALHQYAVSRGEHHMTYKPEVCWLVPLQRRVDEGTADDGETQWTTTITSFDRGSWGPGGADFDWWCTESETAFVSDRPVYRSMEAELREMSSDAVYEELAHYLDDRCRRARKPLPFPLFVR